MKNVTVYMGPMCAFCDAAKRLLNRNNIPYKEINIALEEGIGSGHLVNETDGDNILYCLVFLCSSFSKTF